MSSQTENTTKISTFKPFGVEYLIDLCDSSTPSSFISSSSSSIIDCTTILSASSSINSLGISPDFESSSPDVGQENVSTKTGNILSFMNEGDISSQKEHNSLSASSSCSFEQQQQPQQSQSSSPPSVVPTTSSSIACHSLDNFPTSTSNVDYYNEWNTIVNHYKNFSGLSLNSVVLPNNTTISTVPIGTPVSSQVSTPLSRDSPFFFSDTASSSSCVVNTQQQHQQSLQQHHHQRYPSSVSADDQRLSQQRNVQNSQSHSNMVALDFVTNHSQDSHSCTINMNNRALSYNQMCYAANQQYQTTYSSYHGTQYSVSTTRSHEEDIYEDLCYVTLRTNKDRDNALGTLHLEPIEKRDYCIKELVETEKNYCEALRMIVNQFFEPLSKSLHLEDRRIIFNNLRSLSDLHSKFYQELYRACSQCGSKSNTPTPMLNNTTNNTIGLSGTSIIGSNLIPSVSMPSLSLINFNGGPTTNCAFVADPSQQSSSNSLSSSSSTLLLNGFTNSHINIHNPTTPARLSNCFLTFKDKFVIYGEYCANLPKAQSLLDDLCARNEFIGQFVIKCQNKANDGKFKLRDLLSLPMQRILKYHLLLSELLKSTPECHDDYSGLKEAHDSMLDIGAYINEVKRDTETLEIIREVQRSIVDLSMPDNYELKDYGRLIKDGEVRMRSHDDPRIRLKNRYIFIFDKVVIMCKSLRGLQYSYKEALVLDDFKLEEVGTQSPISKLTKHWTHGWCLTSPRTKQSYTFFVKTEDSKRKWMEAIEKAHDNVRPKDLSKTDHRLAISTVPVATYCACCSKLLRGTWYQGYVCSVCNIAVHKNCISATKPCGTQVKNAQRSILFEENNDDIAVQLRHKNGSRPGSYRSLMTRSMHAIPPTPSKSKRPIAKAVAPHVGGTGQLFFIPNDTIIIHQKDTNQWYGRNVRTGEEGSFSPSCVTEISADSPASSSLESPTVLANGAIRFSYEDPFGDVGPLNSVATLPRKFVHNSTSSSNGIPSPASLVPSSPLAASTPTLHNPNSSSPTVFNFNCHPQQTPPELIWGNGFNLEEYAWFAGSMDRDSAQKTLQKSPEGTFLVRISPKQKNNYAISLKFNGQVKHMRVCVSEQSDIVPTTAHSKLNGACFVGNWPYKIHFYLSETRYFRTIVDLVRWYEINNLSESFNMVNSNLALPYKRAYLPEVLGEAEALHPFSGNSTAASTFLTLKKGDKIAVLPCIAQSKGWWRGQIGDRLGYFPMQYVKTNVRLTNILENHSRQQALIMGSMRTIPENIVLSTTLNNTVASDTISVNSAVTETSNLSPLVNQSMDFGQVTVQACKNETIQLDNQTSNTTANQNKHINSNTIPDKVSPSISPSFSSSSSSSPDTSSPTTLSSPVNSETSSIHSRQPSSDAGIEVSPFTIPERMS